LFQAATFDLKFGFDVQCWFTFKSHLDPSLLALKFETFKLPFFSFPTYFFQAFSFDVDAVDFT
jgi:hypothetical protein